MPSRSLSVTASGWLVTSPARAGDYTPSAPSSRGQHQARQIEVIGSKTRHTLRLRAGDRHLHHSARWRHRGHHRSG
uniref:Putative secreted protein n=1 Tax=Anopheles darlingi TaxID=43151 RepID=A0A2M4DSG4_ANODA